MTTTKALRADVKFAADLTIKCLKLPDGSYGIGVSQIASVFSLPKNHATKEVKALLGKDISLPKTSSDLNSQAVNYITLQQFKQWKYWVSSPPMDTPPETSKPYSVRSFSPPKLLLN